MFLTKWSIENKLATLVLTTVVMLGGMVAFERLGRLEDPEFTIKEAQIITPYPGASAAEVEEEVSERIEIACQQMGQLDKVELESKSYRGLSIVKPTMQDKYDKNGLPQVWDELRRKVGDMQEQLPPGAGPSIVNDDFGDVYGIYLAITGDGYTPAEMKEFLKYLQKELLKCTDVKKVALTALQTEAIYIEPQRERMAQLGIPYDNIVAALRDKNAVPDGGKFKIGSEYITLEPKGTLNTVSQFKNLLIPVANSTRDIYLKDIADVRRGYVEPNSQMMQYNGKTAVGIGISTVMGGNVVTMGTSVNDKLEEIASEIPVGVEINAISFQSDAVVESIDAFLSNLIAAVAIVILVLVFFMGFRSACIIGFVLLMTIFATFIVMLVNGVDLQKISLGALIIALGMLVDNAIVVLDGMMVGMQRGKTAKDAALEVVSKTAIPLAGATAIAILAFAAIGTSQDSTGEFTRSLYQVILYSLSLSWITAVTVTPLLGVMFLPKPKADGDQKDPYDTPFFRNYKGLMGFLIRQRFVTVAVVIIAFAAAMVGFGKVKKSFFPESTRPQFMVNFWLSQGTHIENTAEVSKEVAEYISTLEGVANTSAIIGQGPLRFILTLSPENPNTAYFQILVDVESYKIVTSLMKTITADLAEKYPGALAYCEKFAMGAAGPKIEARISGENADTIRIIAEKFTELARTTRAQNLRSDWRQRVKTVDIEIAEEQANLNGITLQDISAVLKAAYDGATVGAYREADESLPIIIRAENRERKSVSSLNALTIWSPKAGRMIPLRQVVKEFTVGFEDEIIVRRQRVKMLTVNCESPVGVLTSEVQNELIEVSRELELPDGYTLTWGGEMESSSKAVGKLTALLPVIFVLMFLILVVLFNSLRTPVLIWLVVPLALIGVTAGLLGTGLPFGFMAILGVLSLSGMLIKNAIVLIDEINANLEDGQAPTDAVLNSGVSRLRPVAMAAGTTALGMIPLIVDPFFGAMAVTIVAGLVVATALTALVVPVLYSIFYKVPSPQKGDK